MMCFNMIFGDTPSGVYGIYVVPHVIYGWTYVEVAYDNGLRLLKGALGEAVLGGDWWAHYGRYCGDIVVGKVSWRCCDVTVWLT